MGFFTGPAAAAAPVVALVEEMEVEVAVAAEEVFCVRVSML